MDIESIYRESFAKRRNWKDRPPYRAALNSEITAVLERFFAAKQPGTVVSGVRRVGGGASKEQFFFTLSEGGQDQKYLLRMDPGMAITETDRAREFVLLDAMNGIVPVPKPAWVDNDAEYFPQSAAIMHVVSGVAKPSGSGVKVSGLGTWLGTDMRAKLRDQFLEHLIAIHNYDWRGKPLDRFDVPDADPKQAARWSFNFWRELWKIDEGETRPVFALADQWLADNLPDTAELVLTHGDYRTGNYLFDEESGRITAILDWELARIGDFHEDLGWVLTRLFGTFDEDGTFRASDLFEREEFITEYERRSGRTVNRKTLHFYDVLSNYKCYVIVAANGLAAARSQNNHQDVLLTFLGAAEPVFADELAELLSKGDAA